MASEPVCTGPGCHLPRSLPRHPLHTPLPGLGRKGCYGLNFFLKADCHLHPSPNATFKKYHLITELLALGFANAPPPNARPPRRLAADRVLPYAASPARGAGACSLLGTAAGPQLHPPHPHPLAPGMQLLALSSWVLPGLGPQGADWSQARAAPPCLGGLRAGLLTLPLPAPCQRSPSTGRALGPHSGRCPFLRPPFSPSHSPTSQASSSLNYWRTDFSPK